MKKLFSVLGTSLFLFPSTGLTQTTPLSTSNVAVASFGQVEVAAGASGNISLGTDASIMYGAGYSGAGTGTAGGFTLSGDAGFPVEISCQNTATLTNSFGGTLPISGVEVVANTEGTGGFGFGAPCQGTGTTAKIFTLRTDSAENRFSYGVRIDGTGGVPGGGGSFSTSNPGGSAVSFMFAYQ